MQGKQGSDHRAAAEVSRRTTEHPEEHKDVDNVQQQVDVVVRAGVVLEELIVDDVRQPCDRMPVGRIVAGHRPFDGLAIQPGLDVIVASDVGAVVIVDEGVMAHRSVEGDCRDGE